MNELVAYMKAVLEGAENTPLFVQWFAENELQLSTELSRGSFLRLKDNPLQEFARILKDRNVAYSPSPVVRFLRVALISLGFAMTGWEIGVYPHELFRLFSGITRPQQYQSLLIQLMHMIELKQTGDEFWNFSSSSQSWQNLAGCGGICLLRGPQADAIVLMMNRLHNNAMHAELRWFAFHTLQSHSPQPGDCSRSLSLKQKIQNYG